MGEIIFSEILLSIPFSTHKKLKHNTFNDKKYKILIETGKMSYLTLSSYLKKKTNKKF